MSNKKAKNRPSLTDTQRSVALGCLLYDMWILAAAAHYLKGWASSGSNADFGYEWMASTAAQVKLRSIYDFFTKLDDERDITVALLGGKSSDSVWAEKEGLKIAVNKWCAHLTLDRIDKTKKKESMPLRSEVLKAARRVLKAADEYVTALMDTGVKLAPAGIKYRAKLHSLLPNV
jgi:hypothetical protein